MTTIARTHWLTQVLRLIPDRLRTALDAWSYDVARRRAERRRLAMSVRQARAAAVVAHYKLQPWRD